MAMRETVRSLRVYFILTGLIGGASNLASVIRGESAVGAVLSLISLAFSIGYLYAGIRLRPLLATGARQIYVLLVGGVVWLALLLGLALVAGSAGALWPIVVLGLLISGYLYVNVRRLASETGAPAPAPAGAPGS